MARKTREKSNDGFYVVKISRQNNENIFFDREDYEKIREILKSMKEKYNCSLLAYSFIDVRIDMVVKCFDVSVFVKWFVFYCSKYLKKKYKIEENVFKKRYFLKATDKDEIVEKCVKINNIPVRFHKCDENGNYKYSSFSSYFEKNEFVDISFVFDEIDVEEFFKLHFFLPSIVEENENERIFNMKKAVCEYWGLSDFRDIKYIDNNMKKEVICSLYYDKKYRVRDISKLFGIGRQRVYAILKNSWRKTIDKI